ncbi:MAG: zinc ribbon domain-containing protein, partial [Oscillospiraceae bacterium]|nr:zinc ribbon domain-containing protein [Oscillospiraceae bacterium]
MKCKKCNAEVNSNFCPHCGTPVLNNASNQKLLGFRSNKTWKKVISILYLSICLIIFFFSIISSKQENISTYDFIIDKFFQIILCFVFISPYIFLSNTNFRDELPFFKKHKFIYSIFGMFIVLFIFTISISIVNSLHSEEYILKISKSSDSISGINKIETSEESETSSSSNYTNSNINGSEKKDDNIKKPNKNTQNYNDSENKLSESNIIDNQTSELLKKMAIEEVESELIFPKKAV